MSNIGAYLAKKRWNPSNLKNVEEVWKQEQAKKDEEKRIEQLRREYEEDRNREALEELQVKAGVKKTSQRLNWMYDAGGPTSNASKSEAALRAEMDAKEREAFLLGNKSVEEVLNEPKAGLNKQLDKDPKFNPCSSSSGAAIKPEEAQFSQGEMFVRMHEDPMMVIQKKQRELGIRDEGNDEEEGHKTHKKHKRDRKEKKEKKRSSKSRKHRRRRSRSDSESSEANDSADSESRDDRGVKDNRHESQRKSHLDEGKRKDEGSSGRREAAPSKRRGRSRSRSRERTSSHADNRSRRRRSSERGDRGREGRRNRSASPPRSSTKRE